MADTQDGPVAFEVAMYTVTDERLLTARHGEVHDRLRGYDGFVASLALRQIDTPEVFADVIVWRDLPAAKAAAAAIGADPQLTWFGQNIAELRLFTHLTPISDAREVVGVLADAPLVELAVYRPARPAEHAPAHRHLHEVALPGRDGVAGNVGLAGGDGGMVADVIGWANQDVMETTLQAMMADPEMAGFFDPAQETVVFALFGHATTVGPGPA